MKVLKMLVVLTSLVLLSGVSLLQTLPSQTRSQFEYTRNKPHAYGGQKVQSSNKRNVYSKQQDLRTQFTQEVQGVCKGDYEILSIETKEVTNSGYKKPLVEGDFICK